MISAIVPTNSSGVQQEFFSMAELAQLKNRNVRSVHNSVKQYRNFLEGYVYKKYHHCSISGKTRKMWVISQVGVLKLENLMDSPREKMEAKLPNLLGKAKIAERAIAKTQEAPTSIQLLLQVVQ